MKIFAYEICYCRFETGYAVDALFKTKEGAEKYMAQERQLDRAEISDGVRIVEWELKG